MHSVPAGCSTLVLSPTPCVFSSWSEDLTPKRRQKTSHSEDDKYPQLKLIRSQLPFAKFLVKLALNGQQLLTLYLYMIRVGQSRANIAANSLNKQGERAAKRVDVIEPLHPRHHGKVWRQLCKYTPLFREQNTPLPRRRRAFKSKTSVCKTVQPIFCKLEHSFRLLETTLSWVYAAQILVPSVLKKLHFSLCALFVSI